MKKHIVIPILVGVIAAIIWIPLIALYFLSPSYAMRGTEGKTEIAAENERFQIVETVVFDSKADSHIIHLSVVENATGKTVFETTPCRAWDYHGTEFKETGNDFIVRSSDMGDIYFRYNENTSSWKGSFMTKEEASP